MMARDDKQKPPYGNIAAVFLWKNSLVLSMYTCECNAMQCKVVSMSTTMTVRVDDDVKFRLESLAEATQRSRSYLAAQAIQDYVEHNEWQIAEIKQGLAEADAGDFATDSEVKVVFDQWRDK